MSIVLSVFPQIPYPVVPFRSRYRLCGGPFFFLFFWHLARFALPAEVSPRFFPERFVPSSPWPREFFSFPDRADSDCTSLLPVLFFCRVDIEFAFYSYFFLSSDAPLLQRQSPFFFPSGMFPVMIGLFGNSPPCPGFVDPWGDKVVPLLEFTLSSVLSSALLSFFSFLSLILLFVVLFCSLSLVPRPPFFLSFSGESGQPSDPLP